MADSTKLSDIKPNNGQIDPGASAWAETRAAGESVEAVKQNGKIAGEATHRTAEAVASASQESAQASVEALRLTTERTSETMRRTAKVVVEGHRQIAQEAAKKLEDASHKMAHAAQDTSESVRKLMTLPRAAEGGLNDLRQSMAGLVDGVVQTNMRAAQELFRLANPAAMVEMQQRFIREYMDALMQGTATLVRAVRRTADETLPPLEAQIEQRQQARPAQRNAAE